MAKRLKFLVDEHIYLSVVKALKTIKIDLSSWFNQTAQYYWLFGSVG